MFLINSLMLILILILYFSRYKFDTIIIFGIYIYFSIYLMVKIIFYPIKMSSDYNSYVSSFKSIEKLHILELLKNDTFEPIFRILSWLLINVFYENTYLVIVIIINLVFLISLYKLFDDKNLAIISLFCYIYIPLFFPMTTNILRQMLVISLLLLLLSLSKKYRKLVFFLPFIHVSSLIFTLFIFIQNKIKIKYLYIFTIISILCFLTNLNTFIFSDLMSIKIYTSDNTFENYGNKGNRIDFFLLTLFVLILSSLLYKNKLLSKLMFRYSLISACFYFCMGYQAFSERYAIYNWILLLVFIPKLLIIIKKGVKNKWIF